MYNPELIQASILGRARTAKACRDAARSACTIELPESVFLRISTRKKLVHFLEALEINVQAVMHQFDLSVPRNIEIKSRVKKVKIERPIWLDAVNQVSEENEYNI